MNQKTRFNPAFAGPHQQTLMLSSDRGGYWSSVKDDIYADDLRYYLDPLIGPYAWMPDTALLAIPIAMGMDPLRRRGQDWGIEELALMDVETLYPAKRNGVLHRWARDRVGDLIDLAETMEIDPNDLPMSPEEAFDRDMDVEYVAWPWLRNKRVLDRIEKSIRRIIWIGHQGLAIGQKAEAEFVEANTLCFMETGYHVTSDHGIRCSQVRVDLQDRAHEACGPFFGCWEDDLRDHLILPLWSEWEEKDRAHIVHSSDSGFFGDYSGWKAVEIERVHNLLESSRWAEKTGNDPYSIHDEKTVRAAERLSGFVNLLEERQNQNLIYA